MKRIAHGLLGVVAFLSAAALAAPTAEPSRGNKVALVFCAPGYPGTTAEAQPRMDELAAALAELAGWPADRLVATYLPQEKVGLARLGEADAALALVPLPFFLAHQQALRLTARLAVVQKGLEASQAWSLVARKGALRKPGELDGWQVFSTAGYAPAFVIRTALGGAPLPASVKVVAGGQVLSALRKSAGGAERLAVLVDSEQAASLPSLPFAADLEVVQTGPRLPVAVVATVGNRLGAGDWKALAGAFSALSGTPKGKAALEGIRLGGFAPLDEPSLAAARKAFAGTSR
jgi:hypothetical protein